MGLEAATTIDGLVITNPATSDGINEGDDHIRLIKTVLKNNFPGLTAAITFPLSIANGGTGAATAAAMRTNFNLPCLACNNNYTGDNQWGAFSTSGVTNGKAMRNGENFSMLSSRDLGTSASHHIFYNTNGPVGSITTNGSATLYSTASDRDLKDAIVDVDRASAVSKLKAGRPVEFEFIAERGVRHLGFIAQELVDVHPDAVSRPEAPGEPWMADHSQLVPVLWAALQDALARIEVLEAARPGP